MHRHLSFASVFLFGLLATIAEAQSPPGRSYKVAFWFELERPFSTVQYRAYDLARGEYKADAVDRWLKTILDSHPRYGATVRDLTTVGEPGATEADRLKSAVEREKRRWADFNIRDSRSIPRLVGTSAQPGTRRDSELHPMNFNRRAPGDSGIPEYPTFSPFPYPYRSGPR